MTVGGSPARILWVVDREAIENGAVPRALRGGVRRLYLRDASIEPRTWRRNLASWDMSGSYPAVVNGGPAWARDHGLGAHLKAVQPRLRGDERDAWRLLGRSVHDPREARAALADRPDYLVAGPLFPTTSKPGHTGIGPSGLAAIVAAAAGIPVFGIGGITTSNLAAILEAGAHGAAIRSGITAAADPACAAADYLRALENALPVDPY